MSEAVSAAASRSTSPDGESPSPLASRTLAFGPVAVALDSNDGAALEWIEEYFAPWFTPTDRPVAWTVHLCSSRDRTDDLARRFPIEAGERLCFAFDQETLSLRAYAEAGRMVVADPERSCFLAVAPFEIDVIGDPATLRWRFTAVRVVTEIIATRLRQGEIDLHAAAIEGGGKALLTVGPKGAGKTTLSLHLLRSSRFRAMANDRAFARLSGTTAEIRGVPTAVKIRPPTLAQFPELEQGLGAVERPYLHSVRELAEISRAAAGADPGGRAATGAARAHPATAEFALSPAQLLARLGVEAHAAAPLGAVLFSEVCLDRTGWVVEPIAVEEASERIWSNLYGNPSGRRLPTLFEELDGGASFPSPEQVRRLARAAPAYRVLLGRDAYRSGDLVERLLEALDRS